MTTPQSPRPGEESEPAPIEDSQAATEATEAAPDAKAELRSRLRAARAARSDVQISMAGLRIAGHVMALPEVQASQIVAAYASVGTEPSTTQTMEGLRRSWKQVLLPVLCEDHGLEWGPFDGLASLHRTERGLLEPATTFGAHALHQAGVILLPGAAVGAEGHRLGWGYGCYDRTLAETPKAALRCVVLYDDEVLESVPVDPWDQPVDAVITPSGCRRFG